MKTHRAARRLLWEKAPRLYPLDLCPTPNLSCEKLCFPTQAREGKKRTPKQHQRSRFRYRNHRPGADRSIERASTKNRHQIFVALEMDRKLNDPVVGDKLGSQGAGS